MLIYFLPKLQDVKVIRIIQTFLNSKYSMFLIAALALISNIFSLEIAVLYVYLSIVIIAMLFCEDLLSLIPIACCSYYTFSRQNNPLSHDKTSVFLESAAKTNLFIIIGITAVFAISRLVFEIVTKEEKRKLPKLTWGFVALGLAYVIGGIFSGYYDGRTAFFGFTQIASLCFCYFYFYFTVDFKKVKKSYFALLGTTIAVLLLFEIVGMLYFSGFFSITENFNRGLLYTGWGINNNVAAAMVMCLPAPFYYACKKKYGGVFLFLANLLMISLFFVQSRNGILFGLFVFVICFFVTLFNTKKKNLPSLILTQFAFMTLYIVTIFSAQEYILEMFGSLIDKGLSDNGRYEIYRNGFKQFLENPYFGNGFYECGAYRWGDNSIGKFFPSRYHNTYIQILASCGVFAMIAYLYHRFETLKIVFKKINIEKVFMGLIVFALIVMSILDCHFFNFGPGFLYSTILLLLEINLIKNESLTIS